MSFHLETRAPLALALSLCLLPCLSACSLPEKQLTPEEEQDFQSMESTLKGFVDALADDDWQAAGQFLAPETRAVMEKAVEEAETGSSIATMADFKRVALEKTTPDMKPVCGRHNHFRPEDRRGDGRFDGICAMFLPADQAKAPSARTYFHVSFVHGDDKVWRMDRIGVFHSSDKVLNLTEKGIAVMGPTGGFFKRRVLAAVGNRMLAAIGD